MKVFFAILGFVCFFCFQSIGNAKGYRLFVCDYFVSFNLSKDDCKGSNSWYKIYFDNKQYPNRDSCIGASYEWINGPVMARMFPEGDGMHPGSWIFDCDNLWKF